MLFKVIIVTDWNVLFFTPFIGARVAEMPFWSNPTKASLQWISHVIKETCGVLAIIAYYLVSSSPSVFILELVLSPSFILAQCEEREGSFTTLFTLIKKIEESTVQVRKKLEMVLRRNMKQIRKTKMIDEKRKVTVYFVVLSVLSLSGHKRLYKKIRQDILPFLRRMKNLKLARALSLFFPMNPLSISPACRSSKVLMPLLENISVGHVFIVEFLLRCWWVHRLVPPFIIEFFRKKAIQSHCNSHAYALYTLCKSAYLLQMGKDSVALFMLEDTQNLLALDPKVNDQNLFLSLLVKEFFARSHASRYPYNFPDQIKSCLECAQIIFGSNNHIAFRLQLLRVRLMATKPEVLLVREKEWLVTKVPELLWASTSFPSALAEVAITAAEVLFSLSHKYNDLSLYNYDLKFEKLEGYINNFIEYNGFQKSVCDKKRKYLFIYEKLANLGLRAAAKTEGRRSPLLNKLAIRYAHLVTSDLDKLYLSPVLIYKFINHLDFTTGHCKHNRGPHNRACLAERELLIVKILLQQVARSHDQTINSTTLEQIKFHLENVETMVENRMFNIPRQSVIQYYELCISIATRFNHHGSFKKVETQYKSVKEKWEIEDNKEIVEYHRNWYPQITYNN